MSDVPEVPTGLLAGGEKIWNATIGHYKFRPDELRILEDACREADLVDQLQNAWSACAALGEFMVKGSQGQMVSNPMIGELRQHRATLAQLLGKLNLPDAAGETPRSVGARKAANARWAKSS